MAAARARAGSLEIDGEGAQRLRSLYGKPGLGIGKSDLARLPKGAPEKTALAWWVRERTTVSLRWVGQTLAMGHYTRVTQAVSRMKRRPGRKLEAMKQRLLKTERTR